MYSSKDYRDSDAGRLTSYISRGENQLKNRHGEPMTGEEQEEFLEKSEQHQYEEQWVISPANGDELSDEELSLAARKTMTEHLSDRPTADYCYSVHRDTENPHVQVAVTGDKSDLWTEQHDLDQFEERAIEHTREREQSREQELEQELVQEHDLEQDHQQDRGHALD